MGAQQVKERTGGSTLGAGASIRSIRTKPRVPKDARIIASNIFTEHSGEFHDFFRFFFFVLVFFLFSSTSIQFLFFSSSYFFFFILFYEFPPMYYSFACICDCQNKKFSLFFNFISNFIFWKNLKTSVLKDSFF